MDVITAHRLRALSVSPEAVRSLTHRERADLVYQAFLAHVPYENLSTNRAIAEAPDDPECWMRATDQMLRENAAQGLGGTSFSLAYALSDLLNGVGVNAHCTLGYNLVTEQPHAATLVYLDGMPWLYDPALLLSGAVPVRPHGALEDPLGSCTLLPRCGATLTLSLAVIDPLRKAADEDGVCGAHVDKDGNRAVYSIIPVPAPPGGFRDAWRRSFYRGRIMPLRFAKRVGDRIYRYGERPGSVECLSAEGRSIEPMGHAPVDRLHEIFSIDPVCLHAWFNK